MDIAVLCCGPSLRDSWAEARRSDYDLVMAINGAILEYVCDWAACNDRGLSMQVIKRRRGGALKSLRLLMSCYVWAASRTGLELHLPPLYGKGVKYTLPNALYLASRTFPRPLRFHFFGYDANSARDFDGRYGDHSPRRWKMELAVVRRVVSGQGCSAKGLPNVA